VTNDEVKGVLEQRVPPWPADLPRELRSKSKQNPPGAGYDATPDELAAIDEGLAGDAASEEKIKAAFVVFRRA